jgi:hypothetical protein
VKALTEPGAVAPDAGVYFTDNLRHMKQPITEAAFRIRRIHHPAGLPRWGPRSTLGSVNRPLQIRLIPVNSRLNLLPLLLLPTAH